MTKPGRPSLCPRLAGQSQAQCRSVECRPHTRSARAARVFCVVTKKPATKKKVNSLSSTAQPQKLGRPAVAAAPPPSAPSYLCSNQTKLVATCLQWRPTRRPRAPPTLSTRASTGRAPGSNCCSAWGGRKGKAWCVVRGGNWRRGAGQAGSTHHFFLTLLFSSPHTTTQGVGGRGIKEHVKVKRRQDAAGVGAVSVCVCEGSVFLPGPPRDLFLILFFPPPDRPRRHGARLVVRHGRL